MAPTQAFKPRALRISDGHRPLQSERSRTKHAASSNHDRSRRTSKHRSDSLRSKSREGHKRAKLNRRYDEVKKLDVAMDPDAVSGSEDENGSDLHLDKPMYNIGEYLKDRAALVRNMFASLKKDTLSRMIPSVLREFSLEELEEKCVFELNGMSRKRVCAILSGQDLQASSGTDDSEDDAVTRGQRFSSDKQGDAAKSPLEFPTEAASSPTISSIDTLSPADSRVPAMMNGLSSAARMGEEDGLCMSAVEPTEMELVELELRAQALRAMMKQLDEAGIESSPLVDDIRHTNVMFDQALEIKKGNFGEMKDDLTPLETVRRTEKDFFEIHVDEEELAEFE